MNLINDPWIPVLRADGACQQVRPASLTEIHNPITALDAPRADFNAALAQFLIGLLQTTFDVDDDDWLDLLWSPPSPEALEDRFASITLAFEVDGDGPRFMQDLDKDMNGARFEIADLLIDASGGRGYFIKRGTVRQLCQACAVTALFTLQANAPQGGRGHRTSLRGGGPLSTLVVFDPKAAPESAPLPLWRDLWLNVLTRTAFLGHWQGEDGPQAWFPWLRPTRTSTKGEIITAADAHPAVAYWGTPRRIRLDFDNLRSGRCDVCGQESERLVSGYFTRPHGANYTNWEHPLSPHYRQKPDSAEWLPAHPQPGGFGYRHWPELVLGTTTRKCARAVYAFRQHLDDPLVFQNTQFLLWVFGYDMDNMKARCWYEARLPLIELADARHRADLAELANSLVDAAMEAKGYLVNAIKRAWFDPKREVKGDTLFIELAFWSGTEQAFYDNLRAYAGALERSDDAYAARTAARKDWHKTLIEQARRLFDQWAASGAVEYEDPRRIAGAHNELMGRLHGPHFKTKVLHLPVEKRKGETEELSL